MTNNERKKKKLLTLKRRHQSTMKDFRQRSMFGNWMQEGYEKLIIREIEIEDMIKAVPKQRRVPPLTIAGAMREVSYD